MIHSNDGNLSLYKFDSFEEYLDRASQAKWKRNPECNHFSSKFGKPEFTKALDHARHGWPESTDDIKKWSDLVIQDISTQLPKPEYFYEKTGAFWDIGRVIDNDPDCWLHEEPSMDIDTSGGKSNLVRMVINTASSAACRTNAHRNRCGAILALTVLLEQMGFYVEFDITTAIQVQGKKVEFRTVAKRAHEALNLAALSFWCSEFMESRIDFSICETISECQFASKQLAELTDYGSAIYTVDGGDICFDRMHATQDGVDWNDDKSVRQYIIMKLAKQGVRTLAAA